MMAIWVLRPYLALFIQKFSTNIGKNKGNGGSTLPSTIRMHGPCLRQDKFYETLLKKAFQCRVSGNDVSTSRRG
jgi:hypothetical protein